MSSDEEETTTTLTIISKSRGSTDSKTLLRKPSKIKSRKLASIDDEEISANLQYALQSVEEIIESSDEEDQPHPVKKIQNNNERKSTTRNQSMEEDTDAEPTTSLFSNHRQRLKEMQAEMQSLSTKQEELLLMSSSHDENSDVSVLMDGNGEIIDHKVKLQEQVDTDEESDREVSVQITASNINSTTSEKKPPKKSNHFMTNIPPMFTSSESVHQLLEKHKRENELRKQTGATAFKIGEEPACSELETHGDFTESEETFHPPPTHNIPKVTVTKVQKPTPEMVEQVSKKIYSSLQPSSLNGSMNNGKKKPTESSHHNEEKIKLERKKRDLEKDVLLRDSERQIAALTKKLIEYEAILQSQEERSLIIEKEKDLELNALRDLYEEKWMEFKSKEKDWNERWISVCNESTDLSSKTKKQNEQLLQLRQKVQIKTDEAQHAQKLLKEKESEWKEKEKTYINIQKRYNELMCHSREIKKHAEQMGQEVESLTKTNEELTQRLSEIEKKNKQKVKELKEKIESIMNKNIQQIDMIEKLTNKLTEEKNAYLKREEEIAHLEIESNDMMRNYQELRETLMTLNKEKELLLSKEEEKFNMRIKELTQSESQLREKNIDQERRLDEYEAKFQNLKKTVEEQVEQYKNKYEEEKKRSKKFYSITEKQKKKFTEEYEKLKEQILKREKMFEDKLSEVKKNYDNEKRDRERFERRCEHLESIKSVMNSPSTLTLKDVKPETKVNVQSEKSLTEKAAELVAATMTNQKSNNDVSSSDCSSDTNSSSEDNGSYSSGNKLKKLRKLKKVEIAPTFAKNETPKEQPNAEQSNSFNGTSTVVVRKKSGVIATGNSVGQQAPKESDLSSSGSPSLGELKKFEKLTAECNTEFKDYQQKVASLMEDISHHGKELGELRDVFHKMKSTNMIPSTPTIRDDTKKVIHRSKSPISTKKKILKTTSPLKKAKP